MKRLALLLLLACGPHDVQSVVLPDGGKPPGGRACANNSECSDTEYCDRRDCGDISGQCQPRMMCMPMGSKVCGCDGVTYDNRCARRAAGVSEAFPGPCQ